MSPTMVATGSSRRAVRAALLAVSLFLVADVLVGFGTAEEAVEPEVAPPPAIFGTTAPSVGDNVTYQVQGFRGLADGTFEPTGEPVTTSHAWIGQGDLLDSDGAPIRVHMRADPFDASEHHLVDAESERHAGWIILDDRATRQEGVLLDGVPMNWTQSDNDMVRGILYPHGGWSLWQPLACGVYHSLQGNEAAIEAPFVLFERPCLAPDHELLFGTTKMDLGDDVPPLFSAVRTEIIGEATLVVFEADNVTIADRPDPASMRVWLSPDIPYPVRVETEYEQATRHWLVVAELAAWKAGTEPLDFASPSLAAAPPLQYAPINPWGMDDAGIEHPFPLSAAYRRALEDPQYEELRDFVATHDDAATIGASYDEWTTDGEIQRRWSLHVVGGGDYLTLCSIQDVRRYVGAVVPMAVGQALPEAPVVYRAEDCGLEGYPVAAERRASSLPTAASLLARAEAFLAAANMSTDLNKYGFSTPAEADRPSVLKAGIDRRTFTRFPDGEVTWFSSADTSDRTDAVFTLDGRAAALVNRVSEREMGLAREQQVRPVPQGTPSAPLTHEFRTVATWQLPDTRALVGTGLAALIVGALYYIWPLAKGSGVGLFSRVRPDAAFDQEVRGRIEDALRSDPGLHASELVRRLGLSRGAVAHHLKQLVQAGLVTRVAGNHYTCYFLAGSVDRHAMAVAPALRSDGARSVLAAIATSPGSSLTAIASSTGLSPATVHHHAKRLADVGLVSTRRTGRTLAHFITDLGRQSLP